MFYIHIEYTVTQFINSERLSIILLYEISAN
jgi:hypothetical protein